MADMADMTDLTMTAGLERGRRRSVSNPGVAPICAAPTTWATSAIGRPRHRTFRSPKWNGPMGMGPLDATVRGRRQLSPAWRPTPLCSRLFRTFCRFELDCCGGVSGRKRDREIVRADAVRDGRGDHHPPRRGGKAAPSSLESEIPVMATTPSAADLSPGRLTLCPNGRPTNSFRIFAPSRPPVANSSGPLHCATFPSNSGTDRP